MSCCPSSASQHALHLYRAILKEARKLPTLTRRQYVARKTRHEFEQNRLAQGKDQEFQLRFAEAQLDNLIVQREILCELRDTGKLKN